MSEFNISLISPSTTFDQYLLDDSLLLAEQQGLRIIASTEPRLGRPLFLNGSKIDRLNELIGAEQVECEAVWCVRGGCGAIELWHEYQEIPSQGPVLIGYSDNTILHLARFIRSKRIGIHGPVFFDLKYPDRANLEQIKLLINKQAEKLIYPPLKLLNPSLFDNFKAEIIPMNLTSLQVLAGAIEPDSLRAKILALEDINEPPYRVFRALNQLKNAGILFGLKALIIGHFDIARTEMIEQIFMPLAEDLGVPLFDWPIFGHDKPNWPLLFGANCQISKIDGNLFSLRYLEQHDHQPITLDHVTAP